jgi:membrane associated rhomboid family serine protease
MQVPFEQERGLRRWRNWLGDLLAARACWCLIVVFVVVHLWLWSGDPEAKLMRFALFRGAEGMADGWRWVTYAFLHGNALHLCINSAGLWIIGSKVERIAGAATVLKVFVSGVVAGGALHLIAAPPAQIGMPLVGASGGVAALLLWLTTVSPESRTWPIKVSGRNLGRGIVAAEIALLAASWVFADAGYQPIAHACHLGGAVAGWCWGRRMFRRLPTLADLRKERARRESADGPESSS